MKKKEFLIIFLLAVLATFAYFWWQEFNTQWRLAVDAPSYPGLLTPFSHYVWWYPIQVFISWFLVLAVGRWAVKRARRKNGR